MALKCLLGSHDLNGRLARWTLALQQYDLQIFHRPGHSNGNADGLSRLPPINQDVQYDMLEDWQKLPNVHKRSRRTHGHSRGAVVP